MLEAILGRLGKKREKIESFNIVLTPDEEELVLWMMMTNQFPSNAQFVGMTGDSTFGRLVELIVASKKDRDIWLGIFQGYSAGLMPKVVVHAEGRYKWSEISFD